RSETMPTSVSSSTTGRWRMPRCRTSRIASGNDVFGVIVITAACMTSSTSIVLLLILLERSVSALLVSRRPLRTVERDGHRRLPEHVLGNASDERAPDAIPSSRRHRDEVGVPRLGFFQDLLDRVAV